MVAAFKKQLISASSLIFSLFTWRITDPHIFQSFSGSECKYTKNESIKLMISHFVWIWHKFKYFSHLVGKYCVFCCCSKNLWCVLIEWVYFIEFNCKHANSWKKNILSPSLIAFVNLIRKFGCFFLIFRFKKKTSTFLTCVFCTMRNCNS